MKTMTSFIAVALTLGAAHAAWEPVGPDGGYIQALAVDAQDPARVYAVSYEYPDSARLFASTDTGASWEARGRIPQPSISFLAKDPFDDSLLYSGMRQSVYRSTDGGRTWRDVVMPGPCLDMACDPLVPGRVFVSGYYMQGSYRAALFVSTDHGLNWDVSLPDPDTVGYAYGIGVDPVDTGTVYLGSLASQVYKTTDAGEHWTRVGGGIPTGVVTLRLSVNAGDNDIVLAATSAGLYRSSNGGADWSLVATVNYGQDVAFSPEDPSVAYALGQTDSNRLHVSTDYGATWTTPVPGFTATKVAKLVPDPRDGTGAWMSSSYGIHRTTDTGTHWFDAHNGIAISSVSCISASPQEQRRLYLELYEVAVYRSLCGGDSWQRCSYFLSCGNVCGIGVVGGTDQDVLYALEGSG